MKFFEKNLKKMKPIDIALVKLSAMTFGLFVASYFPAEVLLYKWYLLALTLVFAVKPLMKALKK